MKSLSLFTAAFLTFPFFGSLDAKAVIYNDG